MSCSAPACAVPTCVHAYSPTVCYPVGGLGSLTSCGVGAYGVGAYGIGSYGIGSPGGFVLAARLGLVPWASVSGVNQLPPSEVIIQPPAVIVTIPGPILRGWF